MDELYVVGGHCEVNWLLNNSENDHKEELHSPKASFFRDSQIVPLHSPTSLPANQSLQAPPLSPSPAPSHCPGTVAGG